MTMKKTSSEKFHVFVGYEAVGLIYLGHADPTGQAPGLRGRRLAHGSRPWCTGAAVFLVPVLPKELTSKLLMLLLLAI